MNNVCIKDIKECAKEIIAEMEKYMLLPEQQVELLEAVDRNLKEYFGG